LARLPVDGAWLRTLRPGDDIEMIDARGKPRRIQIEARVSASLVAARSERRIDAVAGLRLTLVRTKASTQIGRLDPVPVSVRVGRGDTIVLARGIAVGRPREIGVDGKEVRAPVIACLQPEVVESLAVGDPVLIDDGHIRARVEAIEPDGARLRVERTRTVSERLRPDQGINFPSTRLPNPGLTDLDRRALDVAAEVADIVAVSFVQSPADVERVDAALQERGDQRIGIVAKIETREGIEALPEILAAGIGLGSRPFGVMIARGDLAVEIGYERLAEIQEELLWLCEAAHVPVIWATQVLENLVKTGIPSRAEVTDAAMAERAEGVMLNKGPFILDGLATLIDIVTRMESHQRKKTPRLRALRSWSRATVSTRGDPGPTRRAEPRQGSARQP
jgi:pyruvate kinase